MAAPRARSTPSSKMRPALGLLEARDQPQQRGLAAAGRSEQREKLALINIERQIDRPRRKPPKRLLDALDPQQRLPRRDRPTAQSPAWQSLDFDPAVDCIRAPIATRAGCGAVETR